MLSDQHHNTLVLWLLVFNNKMIKYNFNPILPNILSKHDSILRQHQKGVHRKPRAVIFFTFLDIKQYYIFHLNNL